MYEEYQSDIDNMRKMVASLNAFHDQTHALDTNHQNQMKNFHDAIQMLFGDTGTFTGSAANTLQDLSGKYEQIEQSFDGGTGGTSPHLSTATDYCTSTAKNLQHYLDEFDKAMLNYNNKLNDMVGENVFQQEATLLANKLLGGPYASVTMTDVTAYANGECVYPPETQAFVSDLQVEKWQWDSKMDTLASDPLPALPPDPTDPAPFKADPGSIFEPEKKSNLKPAPPVKIYLNHEQEEKVNSIMATLARAGITGISRESIERLVANGFDEGSILAAIIGWNNAGWSANKINYALEDAAYYVINTIPYGMNAPADLRAFIATLQKGLTQAGYPCISASIGGSAVTGKKYTTGAPFDVGRRSDYDVAIADPDLLEKAKKMGIELRGGGTRTAPLSDRDLRRLGLYNLIEQLSSMSKRDVHFMIYNSVVTAAQRAPTILFITGPCS